MPKTVFHRNFNIYNKSIYLVLKAETRKKNKKLDKTGALIQIDSNRRQHSVKLDLEKKREKKNKNIAKSVYKFKHLTQPKYLKNTQHAKCSGSKM